MSSVHEIETAIRTLPPSDQDELFLRLEEQYAQRFDAQIERDLQNGALDKLVDAAMLEHEAGHLRNL